MRFRLFLPLLLIAALAVFVPFHASHAALGRVTLLVSDIERSLAFYERLGLEKVSDETLSGASQVYGVDDLPLTADSAVSRRVVLRGGGQDAEIALLWYDRPPLASARGNLMGLGTGDIILGIIVVDLQDAYAALDRLGARITRPPSRLMTDNGGSGARLYAYDPDGHMVEISESR